MHEVCMKSYVLYFSCDVYCAYFSFLDIHTVSLKSIYSILIRFDPTTQNIILSVITINVCTNL